MKRSALEAAIYTQLTGNAALMAVADAVWIPEAPQADDGELIGPFPYIVVTNITLTPWDTDDTLGMQAVVQVDSYARATPSASAHALARNVADLVYGALNRATLSITGAHAVDCLHENTSDGWEEPGGTRRFVSLYRVTYDEV